MWGLSRSSRPNSFTRGRAHGGLEDAWNACERSALGWMGLVDQQRSPVCPMARRCQHSQPVRGHELPGSTAGLPDEFDPDSASRIPHPLSCWWPIIDLALDPALPLRSKWNSANAPRGVCAKSAPVRVPATPGRREALHDQRPEVQRRQDHRRPQAARCSRSPRRDASRPGKTRSC